MECGQNLLARLVLIQGNEGVNIDIREGCDGEMGVEELRGRLHVQVWPGCLPLRH